MHRGQDESVYSKKVITKQAHSIIWYTFTIENKLTRWKFARLALHENQPKNSNMAEFLSNRYEFVKVNELQLPQCSIPRPGDRVSWHAGSVRRSGTLGGHTKHGSPTITSDYNTHITTLQFVDIRREDPFNSAGPNWHSLNDPAQLVRPNPEQQARFDRLLGQVTPPGPTYLDFLEEIWLRGFEVFVVGGTVRDVIAGVNSNDVDVVTTMPLFMLKPLVRAMYHYDPSGSMKHGYIRIGGTPGSGDPFIDVKVFCHAFLGTEDVVFGSDFFRDMSMRDFACNSVYYDPKNKVLIDPSCRGIHDAETKQLHLVCESENSIQYAQIWHRYWKFICRGFLGTVSTATVINDCYATKVPAMIENRRIKYMHSQLLSKHPKSEHLTIMQLLETAMRENGVAHQWEQLIAPLAERILLG